MVQLVGGIACVRGSAESTCALNVDGDVRCWGADGYGTVGDGPGSVTLCSGNVCALSPVSVLGLGKVTSLHGGSTSNHVCAIKPNRSLFCWGSDMKGQLGDETKGNGPCECHEAPVPAIALANSVSSVSLGTLHTCALRDDGSVWCWGS